MSEQEPQELAEVIPIFRNNNTVRIAGIKMNLGRMSLEELNLLADQCYSRVVDANTELSLVHGYMQRRNPGGGDGLDAS